MSPSSATATSASVSVVRPDKTEIRTGESAKASTRKERKGKEGNEKRKRKEKKRKKGKEKKKPRSKNKKRKLPKNNATHGMRLFDQEKKPGRYHVGTNGASRNISAGTLHICM